MAETVIVDVVPEIDPFWYDIQADDHSEEDPHLLFGKLIADGQTAVSVMRLVLRWVILEGGVPEERNVWKEACERASRWDVGVASDLDANPFSGVLERLKDVWPSRDGRKYHYACLLLYALVHSWQQAIVRHRLGAGAGN
jgi:hypothetical protein